MIDFLSFGNHGYVIVIEISTIIMELCDYGHVFLNYVLIVIIVRI